MVGIVETGAGNLATLRAALDRLGHAHATLATPADAPGGLAAVDALVVPGQGRFGPVMERLRASGWADALRAWAAADRPLVGICVGLQVLFEGSDEDPGVAGLGLFAGRAARLDGPKRPLVGWADVAWAPGALEGHALAGAPDGAAYFVNSYAVPLAGAPDGVAGVARYGSPFVAAVRRGRVSAVQFHVEVSGAWGTDVLGRMLGRERLGRREEESQRPVGRSERAVAETTDRLAGSGLPHVVHPDTSPPSSIAPRPPSSPSPFRRVIPCLDVRAGRVVKGVEFVGLRDMGDPVELAARYEAEGADEVVFLDIAASAEHRATALDMVRRTAAALSVPFTLGGGLRSVADAHAFLDAGADKVALNTRAVEAPGLVDACAAHFGSQCVVVAVDVRPDAAGTYRVHTHGGRRATSLDGAAWARELADRGAGELLVTAIHRDGTGDGFDTAFTGALGRALPVQVIASGGAATPDHLADALAAGADAVLAATMFHSGAWTVDAAKAVIASRGIPVREREERRASDP